MDKQEEIRLLAQALKDHNVGMESGITISLMLNETDKRMKMIDWLNKNPMASVNQVTDMAMKIRGLLTT